MEIPFVYIDPAMSLILEEMRAAGRPPLESLPLDTARDLVEASNVGWNAVVPEMAGGVSDVAVQSAGRTISARLFRPTEADRLPLIVFAHGGGWTFGSLRTHDRMARLLAEISGLPVLSVEYSLAPEHPFPAARDDILRIMSAVREGLLGEAACLHRHALVGDSAGAHVALTAGLCRPASLAAIGLLYGCYRPDFETESYALFGDGSFGLSGSAMRYYWSNLLGASQGSKRKAAILDGWDLTNLPPAYLIAAGLDALRDDTIALAKALDAAGQPFTCRTIPGVIHGFMQMSLHLPAATIALTELARFLRTTLYQAPWHGGSKRGIL